MANFVKRRFGPIVLRIIEISQLVGHGGRLVLPHHQISVDAMLLQIQWQQLGAMNLISANGDLLWQAPAGFNGTAAGVASRNCGVRCHKRGCSQLSFCCLTMLPESYSRTTAHFCNCPNQTILYKHTYAYPLLPNTQLANFRNWQRGDTEDMALGGLLSRGKPEERANTVAAYILIFVLQVAALCGSHRIIKWKTPREERSMMPAGKRHHVLATHKNEKKQTEQLVHARGVLEQKGIKIYAMRNHTCVFPCFQL